MAEHWYVGDHLYSPNMADELPPYSLTNPLLQNLAFTPPQGVSNCTYFE